MKKVLLILVTIMAVSICSHGQELRPVRGLNQLWGFVDETGKEVIPFKYEAAREFSEGLAAVQLRNERWGFIDKTDNVIIPSRYLDVGDFSEGLARVRHRSELDNTRVWSFIDKNSNVVTSIEYDGAGDFSEGLARVRLRRKWGFINKNSTPIISFKYDEASDFSNGMARVRIKQDWKIIDKTGKEVFKNISTENQVTLEPEVINAVTTNAYDVILLKDGQEIKAKVTEITPSEIKYKAFEHLDGPTRTLAKNDVFLINYANGKREVISTVSKNRNSSEFNRPGQVSGGLSPTIYLEKDLSMFGFCGKLQVGVAKHIRLEGSFTYYIPKTIKFYIFPYEIDMKISMWDVNLNMQTIVTKGEKFLLYPLIGLRVSGVKATASAFGVSESDTFFGMNFGAGFDVKLSKILFLNFEPKYMLSFMDGRAVHGFTISTGLISRF